MRVSILIAVILSFLVAVFFVFGWYATDHFTGSMPTAQRFIVSPNENAFALGGRLEQSGIVFSRYTFLWYLVHEEKTHSIIAGEYLLSGSLTTPEIALILTSGKTISTDVKVTFPEGWTMAKMAERLIANRLPGKEFLELAQTPVGLMEKNFPTWDKKFAFLGDVPLGASLEGYLFPDTYFFAPDATGRDIIDVMLQNFGKKWDELLGGANRNGAIDPKRYHNIVTMASIIEEEGRTKEERDMISDVFWKRLAIGQSLQSDATVNYIHGTTNLQPTYKDLEENSPYNTYMNPGLPPGPISNPGLDSLHAALFPKSNPYYYFLVDLNTGETVYGKTFEEHVQNRRNHGL